MTTRRPSGRNMICVASDNFVNIYWQWYERFTSWDCDMGKQNQIGIKSCEYNRLLCRDLIPNCCSLYSSQKCIWSALMHCHLIKSQKMTDHACSCHNSSGTHHCTQAFKTSSIRSTQWGLEISYFISRVFLALSNTNPLIPGTFFYILVGLHIYMLVKGRLSNGHIGLEPIENILRWIFTSFNVFKSGTIFVVIEWDSNNY